MYDTSPQTSRKKKESGKKKGKGKHQEIVEDYNNEEELAKVNSTFITCYLLCCAHWLVTCIYYVSIVTCYISIATYYISIATCYISIAICYVSIVQAREQRCQQIENNPHYLNPATVKPKPGPVERIEIKPKEVPVAKLELGILGITSIKNISQKCLLM